MIWVNRVKSVDMVKGRHERQEGGEEKRIVLHISEQKWCRKVSVDVSLSVLLYS